MPSHNNSGTAHGGERARYGQFEPMGHRYPERRRLNRKRTEIVFAVGEFCGTFLFLLPGFVAVQIAMSTSVSNTPSNVVPPAVAKLLYIASAFGASLAVNAWIFYRVSGGLFNPAVSLGLLVAGVLPPVRAAYLIVLQLLAGICTAAVVDALTPGPLTVSTRLSSGITTAQGLFLEMFLTAELMMAILLLAVEKHKATFVAPIGIGAALFIDHLAGVYYTGASMNPARSFGPAVIEGFPRYHWIYWLGPCMGACLAAVLYRGLKAMEYQLANPTQDFDYNDLSQYQANDKSGQRAGETLGGVKNPDLLTPRTGNSEATGST